MAGIGIRLDTMMRRGGLGLTALALGQALLVVAGQWLLGVLALGAAALVVGAFAPGETVVAFRLSVVVGMMCAMLVGTPVMLVAGRALSDALHDGAPETVPAILTAQLAIAAPLTGGLCMGVLPILGYDFDMATWVAIAALAASHAALWGLAAQATALDRFGLAGLALCVGTLLGLWLLVQAARDGAPLATLLLAHGGGVSVSTVGLAWALTRSFPFDPGPLGPALSEMLSRLRAQASLAAAGLLGAGGLWIDKLILWQSPRAETSAIGLRYTVHYDGAVFLGLLVLIPGLALLLLIVEVRLFARLHRWMQGLLGHATLSEIETGAQELASDTSRDLRRVLLVQAVMAFGGCVGAAKLAQSGWIEPLQMPVMAFTCVGTVFYLASLSYGLVLLHLDLVRPYLAMQAVFLGATALATLGFQALGPQFLGLGFPTGALCAAVAGLALTSQAFADLPRHVFRRAAAPR